MTDAELEKKINNALVYERLVNKYEKKEKELKAQLAKAENISEIEDITFEIQEAKKKVKRYKDIANEKWSEFEKPAIRENPHEAPFYNLLAAIASVAVDDYRDCCNMLCNGGTPDKLRYSIARKYREIEELFGDGFIMVKLNKEQSGRRKRRIRRRLMVYESMK